MKVTADEATPLKVRVSKEFAVCFQLVAEYYHCSEEEIEIMKVAARLDIEAAEVCYRVLARDIERRVRASGLEYE